MTSLRTLAGCACLAMLLSSCGGSSDTVVVDCPGLALDFVLPAPLASPTGTWEVTYTATSTGGASMTSLQWRDETGALVSVTPPPPTRTKVMAAMPAGTRVSIQAVATATSGSVSVGWVAVSGSPGSLETRQGQSSCGL